MMFWGLALGFFLLESFFLLGKCSNSTNLREVLSKDEGVITDGKGNYNASSHYEWLIDAGSPNRTIHLTFKSMDSECSFDFLFIYDGKSYNSRLIATLSGDSLPRPIVAFSGYMLLYLFSDRNYMKEGFLATYKIEDCPWGCSGHSECHSHKCRCRPGYSGVGCQVESCPDNCRPNGSCEFRSYEIQYCQCIPGFAGQRCDLEVIGEQGQGQWYKLQNASADITGFPARTSHTSVFLDGCIWVFGGFDLNTMLGDLLHFCLSENRWETLARGKDSESENITTPWPEARSKHAMDAYGDGFFVFGGILNNGSHSNELWYFNTTSLSWSLQAAGSSVQPVKVAGHTLTTVEDYLYAFGGKSEDRVVVDSMFRISAPNPDQWEEVLVKGGVYPPKFLMGHSTVYDAQSRSLVVFGGYRQSSALFSDRTHEVNSFSIDGHYWSRLYNPPRSIPYQRAFHSAVIMGNYMVIYGGETQIHANLDICYSQEMFFYHLGCHVWVNHTHFTGNSKSHPMPHKGRFGHTAVVGNGNVMYVVGGYSGQVLGDLVGYKVPDAVASYESPECLKNSSSCSDAELAPLEEDHCEVYKTRELCHDDPECVFCNQGVKNNSNHSCVHSSLVHLCVRGDYHSSTRCPGICAALHTCGACVSQGRGLRETTSPRQRPLRRVYIQECSWCVKEAKCQTRAEPFGTCRAPSATDTGLEGWWGGLSANLTSLEQCQTKDFPAGLHLVKYRQPLNFTFPDELTVVRKTTAIMSYTDSQQIEKNFLYTAKLLGFVHPLDSKPRSGQPLSLHLGVANGRALLYLSRDDSQDAKEKVVSMEALSMFETEWASRKSGLPIFPNVTRGNKYFMEQVTEQIKSSEKNPHLKTTVKLTWNAHLTAQASLKMLTSEFLEPYSNGSCSVSYNCLGCLTDVLCSWCEVTRTCMPRNSSDLLCRDGKRSQYLITSPAECPTCSKHVQCSSCAADPLCEWFVSNAHCTRRLRHTRKAIRDSRKCRSPCHRRSSCSECIIKKGECTWCENTQTCLPLSDYVSRYNYGQCTSWLDMDKDNRGCHSCQRHTSCSSCLAKFGCGWCSSDVNPSVALCLPGDFQGIYGNQTCSSQLSQSFYDLSDMDSSSWTYMTCPDQCLLGLHSCHANATCFKTGQSYRCQCNHGFEGDGRKCHPVCIHNCVHGHCSGAPDYVCQCDFSWTGPTCEVNCGCNNHSTCKEGVGKCDKCIHRTTGTKCDRCQPGSYGNPTEVGGCLPCDCSGHGDASLGYCNPSNGTCYCTGNTKGNRCEDCKATHYGNARDGGRCYLRCDHRVFVTNMSDGALGSARGTGVHDSQHVYCLWVLTVFSSIKHVPQDKEVMPTIALEIEDLEIECGEDAVYVYDGIPWHVARPRNMPSKLLGMFCGMRSYPDMAVYARSGILTVILEGDLSRSQSRSFNATYQVFACPDGCGENQVCQDGRCVCQTSYWGQGCQVPFCPHGCSAKHDQGKCHNHLCICKRGYTGEACQSRTDQSKVDLQLLSDSDLVAPSLQPKQLEEKFRRSFQKFDFPEMEIDTDEFGPSARAGHTLTTCDRGILFLFGGYSLQEGLLDDIWMYNVTAQVWTQIVPTTQDNPTGRYFHAAACIPYMRQLFIFGGFVESEGGTITGPRLRATNALWKFNIESYVWSREPMTHWVPAVAGHTLTHIGSTRLMLIGGFSAKNYFNNKIYEYDANKGRISWRDLDQGKMKGAKPIGIYGHTAVFDPANPSVYVFGGYVFRFDVWHVSHHLFALNLGDKERAWSMLSPDVNSKWESRVFHTAVHMDNMMVVVGGLHDDVLGKRPAKDVLVFRYDCNTWHRVEFKDIGLEQSLVSKIGLAAASFDKSMYIFGGFSGQAVGALTRLTLPVDLCALIKDSHVCNTTSGCQTCMRSHMSGNQTLCYDSRADHNARPSGCIGSPPEDKRCDVSNHLHRGCMQHKSCSQCLSVHPHFPQIGAKCFWCTRCSDGVCLPVKEQCPVNKKCPHDIIHVKQLGDCPEYMCSAATCQKCVKNSGCMWSRQFRRSGEYTRLFNRIPSYNWNCLSKSIKPSTTGKFQSMPPDLCLAPCLSFTSCRSCLNSPGGGGGSKKCVWSSRLQECLTPAYVPLRCSLGDCGFLHSGSPNTCPAECSSHRKCADCIKASGCGWCAYGGMNGAGICMAGGIAGPEGGSVEGNGNTSTTSVRVDGYEKNPQYKKEHCTWSFHKCQPENECHNGHDTCDKKTQDCQDLPENFKCVCKSGYINKGKDSKCEPVCHEGCGKGRCDKPDDCICAFGWVGKNCSVECQCNKHSNCRSVSESKVCLMCQNNTQGTSCQHCMKMFVGNPKDGGRCVPCREFCNNHTDHCMRKQERDLNMVSSPQHEHLVPANNGPIRQEAVCIKCQDNTTGERCQSCTPGHFRRIDEAKTKPCMECHCNGHSNVCNMDTGGNCQCKNNTETNCESKEESDCWEFQCARCKEYFLGTPTDGHQCYRQMNVDKDYCLDPDTQNNCLQNPKSLDEGRTVFFAVQPKYLNVDIRITIDVTGGAADVFISNKENTFQVFLERQIWHHQIYLDKMYASTRASHNRRSILSRDGSLDSLDIVVNDEASNSKDGLFEPRSLIISSDVPDDMKIWPQDSNYYKMTQFESVEDYGKEKVRQAKSRAQEGRESGGGEGRAEDRSHRRAPAKQRGKKHRKDRKWPVQKEAKTLDKLLKSRDLNKGFWWGLYNERRNISRDRRRHRRGLFVRNLLENRSSKHHMEQLRQRLRRELTNLAETKKGLMGQEVSGIKMGEVDAGAMNTYITVGEYNSVLVVRDVRFRLVITLPRDQHDLKSSRFYIIVRSRGGGNATFGNLYFRQDQPHIDLFVFFSVFFSCFFLFLAVCVMLWKLKQTFDARRSRQIREREMECMASRPFAKILVLVEPDGHPYLPISSGLMRRRSRLNRNQNRGQSFNNNELNTLASMPSPRELGVVPIAIEPTEDGMAAVGTVLFQLPGGATAPSRLCLGSSLTNRMAASHPSQKLANLRRRTSASPC